MSKPQRRAKFLVVDDEPHARAAIARVIKLDFGQAVVAEAADAPTALQMIAAERWDVVLLDIFMPGMSGLEALREMRCRNELVPVIVMSGLPADHYEAAAVAAGAFAFSRKDRLAKDLRAMLGALGPQLRIAGQQ